MLGIFLFCVVWIYYVNGLFVDVCLNVLYLRGDYMLIVGKNGINFKVWFRDNYVI